MDRVPTIMLYSSLLLCSLMAGCTVYSHFGIINHSTDPVTVTIRFDSTLAAHDYDTTSWYYKRVTFLVWMASADSTDIDPRWERIGPEQLSIDSTYSFIIPPGKVLIMKGGGSTSVTHYLQSLSIEGSSGNIYCDAGQFAAMFHEGYGWLSLLDYK